MVRVMPGIGKVSPLGGRLRAVSPQSILILAALLAQVSETSWAASSEERAPESAKSFRIAFLDVGQGDAILAVCPDGTPAFVVDSGDVDRRVPGTSRKFTAGLDAYFGTHREIPLVVASHPHSDHIGNLATALRRYRVLRYLDNGQPPSKPSATYRELEEAVMAETQKEEMTRLAAASVDDLIEVCGPEKIQIRVLGPRPDWGPCGNDPNNCSVVLRVDYGKTSFLLTGDAEAEEEEHLLAGCEKSRLCDTDVLKAGHHGSETSTGLGLLRAVSPRIVVISSGKPGEATNKGYRHPRLKTLDAIMTVLSGELLRPEVAFEAFDSAKSSWTTLRTVLPIYLTAVDGSVLVASDGNRIRVETARDRDASAGSEDPGSRE